VGSKTEEVALMSTEVISQPTISHRGRRRLFIAALATVAAVGVAGAVVVARSSGGTSGGHAVAEPPAVVVPPPSLECGVDVEYLAAEVGTMSETGRPGVIAALSPQMRELVHRAIANQTAVANASLLTGFAYSPPVPDGPTLARVLAAVRAADARAIVSGLSAERRAELAASPVTVSPAGAVCP
jgi:hypothetical protein